MDLIASWVLFPAGETYELWQRPPRSDPTGDRLGLGTETDPVGVPECERVRRLASAAPPGSKLVAARREQPVVLPLSRATYPTAWGEGRPNGPRPTTAGVLGAELDLARAGTYELWLGGSVRPRVDARIDGLTIGTARHELNNEGGYVSLGTAHLERGKHRLEIEFEGTDLAPGIDGSPGPIGPLALARSGAAEARLVRTAPAAAARRLCGRTWDWVEIVGG